jgi:hypothetical protein
MSNAKQSGAITVAMNDQAEGPATARTPVAMNASAHMAQSLEVSMAGAAPAGGIQDGGMLVLTALAAVVVLALRRRQR